MKDYIVEIDQELDLDLEAILESMGITVDSRNGYAHNHYEAKSTDCPADYWDKPHDPWFD